MYNYVCMIFTSPRSNYKSQTKTRGDIVLIKIHCLFKRIQDPQQTLQAPLKIPFSAPAYAQFQKLIGGTQKPSEDETGADVFCLGRKLS